MDILDLFYNHVVVEATKGRIDCYFHYNIVFNTYIAETNQLINSKDSYKEAFVPTLVINNKQIFDSLLVEYVDLASKFYKFTYFDNPVMRDMAMITDDTVCKHKLILATLWLNATAEDYSDPIMFLRKRISFLKQNVELETKNIGYSNILKSNLYLKNEKSDINYETPYHLSIYLKNEENNICYMPNVRYGLYDDTVYIYAIQSVEQIKTDYIKKVNRLFYKIGEGFDDTVDNNAIYDIGNLKDITASFLVSLNMAIVYFQSLGYRKVIIPSFLISRWNSSVYAINRISIFDLKKGKYYNEKEELQKNITDKFIRTFLRLVSHYDGIEIRSYPSELDGNLHLVLSDELNCNNSLLRETANIIKEKSHKL